MFFLSLFPIFISMLNTAQESGFDSWQGQVIIILFFTASRLGQGAHPASYLMGTRGLLGVMQEMHEADISLPSSAKVKNGGSVPLLSHTSSWCGA
jgi:hypothetical protein